MSSRTVNRGIIPKGGGKYRCPYRLQEVTKKKRKSKGKQHAVQE